MGLWCRFSLTHLVDACGREPLCFDMKYCKVVGCQKDGMPYSDKKEKRATKDPQGRDFTILVQIYSKLEEKVPIFQSIGRSIKSKFC